MNPREFIEGRQMFVVNYLRQMSALGDHLERLVKHDNVVNRVFNKFIQSIDIDDDTKLYFKRFDLAKQIIRSPDLLRNSIFLNEFLDICPLGYWKEALKTELMLYSPHEPNGLDLLREFRDMTFTQLILTTGYDLFCSEIELISNRILKLLDEIYSAINSHNLLYEE